MNIDCHAHYVPPAVIERLRRDGASFGVEVGEETPQGPRLRLGGPDRPLARPILAPATDLPKRIDTVRETRLDRQILSAWMDIVGYTLPVEQAVNWSRLLNDSMREALADGDRDGLFRGTATVPLQDGARAAEELEYAVKECGLMGAMIGPSIGSANLDDPWLDPFWKAAERMQVPLIIHPLNPLGIERLGKYFLTHIVGLLADTTVGVASMYFSGVLDRFPDLRIILCHGGGFLPYQFGRMTRGREIQPDIQKATALMGRDVLRWFYYDTIVFEPDVLEFLIAEAGADHVLMGSDCPFGIGDPRPLDIIDKIRIDPADKAKILGGNAERLFGDRV